jgi:hypothetical protein
MAHYCEAFNLRAFDKKSSNSKVFLHFFFDFSILKFFSDSEKEKTFHIIFAFFEKKEE